MDPYLLSISPSKTEVKAQGREPCGQKETSPPGDWGIHNPIRLDHHKVAHAVETGDLRSALNALGRAISDFASVCPQSGSAPMAAAPSGKVGFRTAFNLGDRRYWNLGATILRQRESRRNRIYVCECGSLRFHHLAYSSYTNRRQRRYSQSDAVRGVAKRHANARFRVRTRYPPPGG